MNCLTGNQGHRARRTADGAASRKTYPLWERVLVGQLGVDWLAFLEADSEVDFIAELLHSHPVKQIRYR